MHKKYWNIILPILVVIVFNCCATYKLSSTSSETDIKLLAENYMSDGIAYHKNGNDLLAVKSWKKALELIPKDAEVYNFIGISYHKLNSIDSALAYFKRATELDANYYQAFNNMGYIYFQKMNYIDAEKYFKSALSINRDYQPAILNLKKVKEKTSNSIEPDNPNLIKENGSYIGKKNNVAILNLNPINISNANALAFTHRLQSELFRIGRFYLIEREKMQEILEEQGFQQTGCTSSECLVEAGKLLNVEQIIGGSISNVGSVYSIELRLINVETGKIVGIATEDINGSVEYVLLEGIKKVALKISKYNSVQ